MESGEGLLMSIRCMLWVHETNESMTDYDESSKTYNNSRVPNPKLVELFATKVRMSRNTSLLDFGCGTGNYLTLIKGLYDCKCCGVEPSDGMRTIAKKNNPSLTIRKGDHKRIPFDDASFDFIFMTDVIHHVPDIDRMFQTLHRRLRTNGLLCIVTESWDQIGNRWYNQYFPSLAASEKMRYPDIEAIVHSALNNGFLLDEIMINTSNAADVVSDRFIQIVEEKNYSMFRHISEGERMNGLTELRKDMGKTVYSEGAGDSLVWLKKGRA
jgi:ubiquinone/menaquinone biosynthesis C-methylase UbiE